VGLVGKGKDIEVNGIRKKKIELGGDGKRNPPMDMGGVYDCLPL